MIYNPETLFTLYLIRHGQTVHNTGTEPSENDSPEQRHNPSLTETGTE